MAADRTKKIGTKVLAWILIGAMILTFICAIIVVLVQQANYASLGLGF